MNRTRAILAAVGLTVVGALGYYLRTWGNGAIMAPRARDGRGRTGR